MKVKVKLDYGKIAKINNKLHEALLETADALKTDLQLSQTMPKKTGQLQEIRTTIKEKKDKVMIIHDTPYARRLYFHPEYNFNKALNENAGALWWEPYLTGDKKELPKKLFNKMCREKQI